MIEFMLKQQPIWIQILFYQLLKHFKVRLDPLKPLAMRPKGYILLFIILYSFHPYYRDFEGLNPSLN